MKDLDSNISNNSFSTGITSRRPGRTLLTSVLPHRQNQHEPFLLILGLPVSVFASDFQPGKNMAVLLERCNSVIIIYLKVVSELS